MKQKVSAAVAVLGPVLVLIALSCVTYQVEATTDLTTAPTPLLLWYAAWGVLAGLYLALTVLWLPPSIPAPLWLPVPSSVRFSPLCCACWSCPYSAFCQTISSSTSSSPSTSSPSVWRPY